MNRVILSGRLGDAAEIRHRAADGVPFATFRVATDEGYRHSTTKEWVDKVAWHRCLTSQTGLVQLLKDHGKKGRFVEVIGTLSYQTYQKEQEATKRTQAEITIGMDGSLRFPIADGNRERAGNEQVSDPASDVGGDTPAEGVHGEG